ncbi:MAG: VanZ family protein [Coriobacteriia bacterium]|nr:VanZ family protein [Coriobacteriia bacterium]
MRVRSVVVRWAPATGWMAVIFWLSSRPGSDVPSGIAPYAHFGAYAVLGALVLYALSDPTRWLPAVAFASLYGITDEFHQAFIPGRTPDPLDWAIDTAGAIVGAVVLAWWLSKKRRSAL